jgi:hypothetical protein
MTYLERLRALKSQKGHPRHPQNPQNVARWLKLPETQLETEVLKVLKVGGVPPFLK